MRTETVCSFEYLWPGGLKCSGLGDCEIAEATNETQCLCVVGIEAVGDFVFQPLDCDQNEAVLLILYIIYACITLITAVYGALQFSILRRQGSMNYSVALIIVLLTFSSLCGSAQSWIKIQSFLLSNIALIGESYPLSIFFSLTGLLYWSCAILWIDKLTGLIVATDKLRTSSKPYYGVPRKTLMFFVVSGFVLPPGLCHIDKGKQTWFNQKLNQTNRELLRICQNLLLLNQHADVHWRSMAPILLQTTFEFT